MFYTFDKTQFPIIYISLFQINENSNLDDLFTEWKQLYQNGQSFHLIFDTTNIDIGASILQHSFGVISFIRELKSLPPYLDKSVIIINNDVVKNMLYFIFQVQPPVGEVYVTQNKDVLINDEWLKNNCTFISD